MRLRDTLIVDNVIIGGPQTQEFDRVDRPDSVQVRDHRSGPRSGTGEMEARAAHVVPLEKKPLRSGDDQRAVLKLAVDVLVTIQVEDRIFELLSFVAHGAQRNSTLGTATPSAGIEGGRPAQEPGTGRSVP